LREYGRFDKVVGFGDNLNDIPLFRACEESYAMSNAVEELKEIATGIIASNNEDGVARFIAQKEL
jgi:hydroxymethylpyrimidine pyrophosphatase-like HAD family hydrolase